MATSKPLYVYLQRPDTGDWVTVGRYVHDGDHNLGIYRYAPSYERAGLAWSIDPVNLPYAPDREVTARRYGGLHDVLRDACPDSWGRMLLQREHGIPSNAPDYRYLLHSSNADRWGALAVGTSKTPPVSHLASPRLPHIDALIVELLAIAAHAPPVNPILRKRLVAINSLGGARPKVTVQDGERFWLVKPRLPTDVADIPLLEHAAHQWALASGLQFAQTFLHAGNGVSAVQVLRFDRTGSRRRMTLSAATMLGAEYPGNLEPALWSYPRLAEELKRIGAPKTDLLELFGRMVFNAVCGNDDDHPRNHAAVFEAETSRWRLSPAFDVVPNPVESPSRLTMQLSKGRYDISREAMLADCIRFGFASREEAALHLNALLKRIEAAFPAIESILPEDLRTLLHDRLREAMTILGDER